AGTFELLLDWIMYDDAAEFVRESFGRGGQVLAVVGAIVLSPAVLVLMPLAMVRVTALMVRHRHTATRTTIVLGLVWITCVTFGVEVGGAKLATRGTAQMVENRVEAVRARLADGRVLEQPPAPRPAPRAPTPQ